VKGRSLHHY